MKLSRAIERSGEEKRREEEELMYRNITIVYQWTMTRNSRPMNGATKYVEVLITWWKLGSHTFSSE
jgi:hypothetical protein